MMAIILTGKLPECHVMLEMLIKNHTYLRSYLHDLIQSESYAKALSSPSLNTWKTDKEVL